MLSDKELMETIDFQLTRLEETTWKNADKNLQKGNWKVAYEYLVDSVMVAEAIVTNLKALRARSKERLGL